MKSSALFKNTPPPPPLSISTSFPSDIIHIISILSDFCHPSASIYYCEHIYQRIENVEDLGTRLLICYGQTLGVA